MARDLEEELKQWKRDYFDLEEARRAEKDSLVKVINTFCTMVAPDEEAEEEVRAIRDLVRSETALPLDLIQEEVGKLKTKIIARENAQGSDNGGSERQALEERLVDSCRIIKRIMATLLDGFYPMPGEMEERSKEIQLDCKGEIAEIELKEPTDAFLGFMQDLKSRISNDFSYINETFLLLLDQVKELEKTLSNEFAGTNSLKEIEYFEMKINREVGFIANSFNIYTTINEIKSVVIEKIRNIESLVSLRKKKEMKKAKVAHENIKRLQKRISEAEKDARKMSRRAKQYHVAAIKDELTGLYNRRAFDTRVQEAFNRFTETGETFSLILVDVDKLKEINDSFGHVAGDKVIQKVAQCLEETFRRDDFIARYGGDEFVILIDSLTEDMAEEKISNFRKNLKKRRFFSYKDGEVQLTASAGFALAMEGDNPSTLLERADQAMYASKRKTDS